MCYPELETTLSRLKNMTLDEWKVVAIEADVSLQYIRQLVKDNIENPGHKQIYRLNAVLNK